MEEKLPVPVCLLQDGFENDVAEGWAVVDPEGKRLLVYQGDLLAEEFQIERMNKCIAVEGPGRENYIPVQMPHTTFKLTILIPITLESASRLHNAFPRNKQEQ